MKEMEKLILGCVNNDNKSQEKLYNLMKGKMLMVCHKYTNDTDTAQEIMQLGFIKLFNNISKYDNNGSFDGWLTRLMRNTAIDYLRTIKRRYESVGEVVNLGQTYMESYDDNIDEIYVLALETIEELSPAYKKVFTLNNIEQLQHKEIAEILGINEGTSKSNLFKAKITMKRLLSEKMLAKDLVY